MSTRGRIIFWLILLCLVGPVCGCPAGMAGTAIFPPMAKLAAPLACTGGTLQSRQFVSSSSSQISYSARFQCVNSQTGVSDDVTTPVLYVNGVIFGFVLVIVLALIMILFEGFRYVRGRSVSPKKGALINLRLKSNGKGQVKTLPFLCLSPFLCQQFH
jgi:hypothetical protein